MAFRLVIAEKPSVAQTIAAALGIKGKQDGYIEGGGYLISWCVGHLVQLAEAAAYGEQYKKWSFDSLPILPEEWQYAVDPVSYTHLDVYKRQVKHRYLYPLYHTGAFPDGRGFVLRLKRPV